MAVAINKAYADDSKPNDRVWVLAGYMGHDYQWEDFERAWQEMLDRHDVPYFHMKEMAKPKGVYAKWYPPQEHEGERRAFFKDLTSVINDCYLRPFCSIVRMDDLERFNSEAGTKLEPYPLAAYGCMAVLAKEFEDIPVEIVFDHLDRVYSKLDKAFDYAKNDAYYPHIAKRIIPIPLPESITWREVKPLQAADFLAHEMQKQHLRLDDWFAIPDKPIGQIERSAHMDNWALSKYGSIRPPARKTLDCLVDNGAPPSVIIWTYENLWQAHHCRGGVW